jgi:hypothetical protein
MQRCCWCDQCVSIFAFWYTRSTLVSSGMLHLPLISKRTQHCLAEAVAVRSVSLDLSNVCIKLYGSGLDRNGSRRWMLTFYWTHIQMLRTIFCNEPVGVIKALGLYTVEVRSLHTLRFESLKLVCQPLLVNKL